MQITNRDDTCYLWDESQTTFNKTERDDLDMLPLGCIPSVWDNENNCELHKQTSLLENQHRERVVK